MTNALYLQDNARLHTDRISQCTLQYKRMLFWPGYSFNLSLIEHIWHVIGHHFQILSLPPAEVGAFRRRTGTNDCEKRESTSSRRHLYSERFCALMCCFVYFSSTEVLRLTEHFKIRILIVHCNRSLFVEFHHIMATFSCYCIFNVT